MSLGLLGLLFATTLLSGVQLGWVPTRQAHMVAIGILVFSVPLQFIACIYGFLARDAVCATGMGTQAGMWAAVSVTQLRSPPGSTAATLGLILLMGTVTIAVPAAGAARSKILAATVFVITGARWGVTAGYEFTSAPLWGTFAGALGILLAAVALYAALAFELEDQRRQTILPTLRRSAGVEAMTGSLAMQVDQVEHEAGIRKQL